MSVPGEILVVDDTLTALIMLAELLTAEGYQVRSAQSGELALEAAQKDPPELILLDFSMPNMDGIEVCRRLKSNVLTRDIPVLFLSSIAESKTKVHGFEAGAVDFINKPFQRNELLARVSTHLDLARLKRNLSRLVDEKTASLRASEQRFRALIEQAPEAILVFNLETGRFVDANRKAEELTARPLNELITLAPADLYASTQPDGLLPVESVQQHSVLAQNGEEQVFERVIARPNGSTIQCEVRLTRLPTETGNLLRASYIDISARIAAQEKIHRLAYYDTLTGLLNQSGLQAKLQKLLDTMSVGHERSFALFLVDLDDFKFINDAYGHRVGNVLLCNVAQRLEGIVAGNGYVARQGGDEFVVLLTKISGKDEAEKIASLVMTSINKPFFVDQLKLSTSASIGVSLYPDHGDRGFELLRNADMAMYQAKMQGKRRIKIFEIELGNRMLARIELEKELRTAIEKDQLVLHYQPLIKIINGGVIGVEALMRWQHPEKGMISPATFIPIAEQTGLIVPLGRWVLKEACHQLKRWQEDEGISLIMAVNLSVAQFSDPGLPECVAEVLEESGVPPDLLELEITESCAMLSPQQSIKIMQQFRDQGIRISIDDFGTGYSSLSYLSRLPADTLKIDQSFIKNIDADEKDTMLCDTIAYLAHKLGMQVIAEGVETEQQLKFLISICVDIVQGYKLCRPIPAADIPAFIRLHPGQESTGMVEYF